MLVIAPTRELAIQIGKDAQSLAQYTDLRTTTVYGGIEQHVFNLKKLEICVLDEADRMFDLGFIADIRYLLRRMPEPEQRMSMLFSATLSHRVMELAYEHMNNPTPVKTENTGVTAEGVNQQLFQPATDEKISLLLGLMQQMTPARSIIFVNTKRTAEYVEGYLMGNDINCGTLSGDVRQNKRQRILNDFTAGKLPVLIATDVAARGLHIDAVTHVFNYDLPQQAEDYVHRIGRTARAGTRGEAVSFACEEYSFSLPEIQEYIGKPIPLSPITGELLITPKKAKRIERDRVPSFKGGKPGGKRTGKRRSRRGANKGGGEQENSQQKTTAKKTSKSRRRRSKRPSDTPK